MDFFFAARGNFGLIIDTEKTVVMHQPPSNTAPHNAPQISVNETQLQVVRTFTYLDSTLYRGTKLDDEEARWISKASHSLRRHQNTVRNRYALPFSPKIKMYKAVIFPT
nr:unnamed protein product [Spirometra erinaceieuropaei]